MDRVAQGQQFGAHVVDCRADVFLQLFHGHSRTPRIAPAIIDSPRGLCEGRPMTKRMLIVRGPHFFSAKDEDVFFGWLQSIGCIGRITGRLRSLYIPLRRAPSDAQLRELLALFHRYRMNMRPLAILKTGRNAKWFADRDAYWYKKVFDPS
jgi:hypothetical protein